MIREGLRPLGCCCSKQRKAIQSPSQQRVCSSMKCNASLPGISGADREIIGSCCMAALAYTADA